MKNDYSVLNAHRVGASHIAKGLRCEDYSLSYIDDNVAIAVISDGHGDKNCFRSAEGAKIACETAVSITKELCSVQGAVEAIMKSPDRVICELEKSIIYRWNRLVVKDVKDNPIREEEIAGLEENVIAAIRSGARLQKVYGCTLILTVILKGFWFGIHIGDGKCVSVHENGLYDQPIPWDDEGCVGNRSTSICDSRAFGKFRYVYGEEIPVAVFVGSDGVDESFDDNGLNRCYFSLANWLLALPEEENQSRVEELLEKISHGGSGDDVSVACIVSKKKELKKPISTSKQVADKMESLFNMLTDAEERCKDLKQRENELTFEIQKEEKEIRDLEYAIAQKKKDLDSRKAEKESVSRNLLSMQNQLAPMIKQFEEAKEIKRKVDEYWVQLGVEVYDNKEVMAYIPSREMKEEADAPEETPVVVEESEEVRATDAEKDTSEPDKETVSETVAEAVVESEAETVAEEGAETEPVTSEMIPDEQRETVDETEPQSADSSYESMRSAMEALSASQEMNLNDALKRESFSRQAESVNESVEMKNQSEADTPKEEDQDSSETPNLIDNGKSQDEKTIMKEEPKKMGFFGKFLSRGEKQ